jgi:tRNA (uracil-5-)-methyltransferase
MSLGRSASLAQRVVKSIKTIYQGAKLSFDGGARGKLYAPSFLARLNLSKLLSYEARDIAAVMEHNSRHRSRSQKHKGPSNKYRRRNEDISVLKVADGSPKEVLDLEAKLLLEKRPLSTSDGENPPRPSSDDSAAREAHAHHHSQEIELELEIEELSSTGEGLAYSPNPEHNFIFVVAFSVPGDKILARTFKHQIESRYWVKVDFVEVLEPSALRRDASPKCPYFTKCSGCQLQMLPYEEQLDHKKTIVEKAFRHFSNLDPSLIPKIDDTIGSPLQYGYRTKLTPHYDGPYGKPWQDTETVPAFGFSKKNMRAVLDIEQCPIGTEILNAGLKVERKKMAENFAKSNNGKTILLRESTKRELLKLPSITQSVLAELKDVTEKSGMTEDHSTADVSNVALASLTDIALAHPENPSSVRASNQSGVPKISYTYPHLGFRDIKTYTSDNNGYATEHIGPYTFTTLANSFFQNNNSILPKFLAYIRANLLTSKSDTTSSDTTSERKKHTPPNIRYLLDAYCGSGLFSISLASEFSSVLGIDIDPAGISCARQNATINFSPPSPPNSPITNKSSATTSSPSPKPSKTISATTKIPKSGNLGFIAADAKAIFDDVPFPADQTLCIIDPPRKGASVDFLRQMCEYGPKRVVYVSCNVHTQARDVGFLVQGLDNAGGAGEGGKEGVKAKKMWRYEIEKLGGFDFFPQTGHVEGVCFLNRVDD